MSLGYAAAFAAGAIVSFMPQTRRMGAFKYWFIVLAMAGVTYSSCKELNMNHFEHIVVPYFEKYKVK